MWWATDDDLSTERAWEHALLSNFVRAQKQLTLTERAFGRPRVFRIESVDE
jgi:hypothetical protein